MKSMLASVIEQKQFVMQFQLRNKMILLYLQVKDMRIFKLLAEKNIRIQMQKLHLKRRRRNLVQLK